MGKEVTADIEPNLYEAQVKQALQDVFGYYLAKDLDNKHFPSTNKGNLERRDFIKRRLAIYFDAVLRGEPILQKKLGAGKVEIIVLGNNAIRSYTFEHNALRWELFPKSSDVFEQARFYEKAKSQNIPFEGGSDPWTDPYLINEMLQEGIKLQESFYAQFQDCSKQVADVEEYRAGTLFYIPSVKEQLLQIKVARSELRRSSTAMDIQEYFISEYVAKNHHLLEKLPKVADICRQILSLHQLYREKDQPLSPEKRYLYENSLIIELVGNPKYFNNPGSLIEPQTSVGQLFKVGKLIQTIRENPDKQQAQYELGLVAYWAIEEAKTNLGQLFLQLGIPESMGMEYLRELLAHKLKDFPGSQYLDLHYTSPKDLHRHLELNSIFRFVKPIEAIKIQNPITDTHKVSAEVITSNFFPLQGFSRLAPKDKGAFIGQVFSHPLLKEGNNYQRTILKLARVFDIKFSPSEHKFIGNQGKRNREITQWLNNCMADFFKVCAERVSAGDQEPLEVFERMIIQKELPQFLRKMDLPTSGQKYLSDIIDLNSILKDTPHLKDANLEVLAAKASSCALSVYYRNAGSVNLETEISNAINFINSVYPPNSSIPNRLITSNEEFARFKAMVQQKTGDLLNEFLSATLGKDYPAERSETLAKILRDSSR